MANPRRIFVVEDHPTTARALKMYLESHGYDVAIAQDVASALDHAKREPFDLLICDLSLPDGTGWDLMKKLSSSRQVRGIAFSASGSDDDIARSKQSGFLHHLVKGCSADELVVVIQKALNSHPTMKRSQPRAPDSRPRKRTG